MKRFISLLLCLVLLAAPGMSAPAALPDEYGTVTGEYKYLASLGFVVKGDPTGEFTCSDAYFTHSGYEYDHEPAKMTMDLVNASSSSSDVGWEQANTDI